MQSRFFPPFYIFLSLIYVANNWENPNHHRPRTPRVCSVRGTTLWPMRLFKCSGINLPGPRGSRVLWTSLIHRSSPSDWVLRLTSLGWWLVRGFYYPIYSLIYGFMTDISNSNALFFLGQSPLFLGVICHSLYRGLALHSPRTCNPLLNQPGQHCNIQGNYNSYFSGRLSMVIFPWPLVTNPISTIHSCIGSISMSA